MAHLKIQSHLAVVAVKRFTQLKRFTATFEWLRTGQKYVGEFVADKCHGKGKQIWPETCLNILVPHLTL